MTLDIIKPRTILQTDNTIVQAGTDALVTGMANGTVLGIHSAVECVNTALGTHFGGQAVRPYFKALHKDLKAYDTEANRLAREGNTIPEIVAELAGWQTQFTLANLQQMKIEVYSSLDAWLLAMTK